ncbi:MAG: protein kinase, partial [Anaerolineae bacterium]|nr:protein kinase [Anaerolineae bacterium]
ETINNRYEIKVELGRGGMGTVYRAHDSALSRDVAVKLMSNTKLGTEGRARLQHEAQIIAQLNHPNIVTVFDVGEYQNFPFIVMELVEGGTLHDSRPTELPEILAAARQIATALQHAHSHDIIHRDLKPENISLDSENNIRLMDFGLARSVASRLTSEGGIVGTVYYMAPEQAMGKDVSPSADLYALGVILYELTTGALPFEDPDPIAVISQHIHAPPINARLKNPDLPPRLSDLIMSLLSKEPEERPASAQVILSALEDSALLDTTAAPAEELSLLDRIVRGRIIGRKTEFEEARALWSKTQSGQGQLLLISGEPGVGKTRLMREIATHAEVSGGRALIGESFADGNPPYGAFGQVVRSALTADSSNGFHLSDFVLADLLNIAPELRQHYPDVPPNPSLEPEAQRQRLFENVTSFCAALTEQRPLLVVIDDAHWSDSGTLFLLRHLARRTQDLPVMLVATYREIELIGTHPLNELLLELNRQRLGSRVKLSRLDVNDTRQLLEAIFAEFVSLEFAEIIYRETEGNPFFIEEVCKSLVESGVLYYQDGEWHRPDLEEIQIPQSVQVAVEARLSNLDAQTIDILRLAATLGREFEFNTLTKTGETTEDQVINALEIAEEAQLLSEVSGKAGGVFSFAHALIPAALISGLSGLRRRRLHRQALAAEQELHPEDFASLSHHASEAGDVENTLQYAEKAGTTAAALYAWEEAHAQYQRAI